MRKYKKAILSSAARKSVQKVLVRKKVQKLLEEIINQAWLYAQYEKAGR